MAGMIPTPAELLRRLGGGAEGATAAELPHNRWLSPGVWRIRAGSGQSAVLKYTQSARSRGETSWDAHWTAGDLDPHRWTYWNREPLAYQTSLPGAYAGSGVTAPPAWACTSVTPRRRCCWSGPTAGRGSPGRAPATARPPRGRAGRRRRSCSAGNCRRCPG